MKKFQAISLDPLKFKLMEKLSHFTNVAIEIHEYA